MALSPPKASGGGTPCPPRCEEGHHSLHTHPCDCDGLHPLDSSEGVWSSYLQRRSHSRHYGTAFACFALKDPLHLGVPTHPEVRIVLWRNAATQHWVAFTMWPLSFRPRGVKTVILFPFKTTSTSLPLLKSHDGELVVFFSRYESHTSEAPCINSVQAIFRQEELV